ncbi:GGDEF/EAL domain-containing response regulator [Pseudoalteromonas xiamenensis]
MSKILLVDDDTNVLKALTRAISSFHYEIISTNDPFEAESLLLKHHPEVLITDFRMPGLNGFELIERLKKYSSDLVCIVLSGQTDFDDLKKLLNSDNVARFISKPWSNAELINEINLAFQNSKKLKIKKEFIQNGDTPLVEVDEDGNILDYNYFFNRLLEKSANTQNLRDYFDLTLQPDTVLSASTLTNLIVSKLSNSSIYCIDVKLATGRTFLLSFTPVITKDSITQNFSSSKTKFIKDVKRTDKSIMICIKIRDLLVKNVICNNQVYSETLKKIVGVQLSKELKEFHMLEISYDQGVFWLSSVENEIEVHSYLDEIIIKIREYFDSTNVQVDFAVSYVAVSLESNLAELLNNLLLFNQYVSDSKTKFYMKYSDEYLVEKLTEHRVSDALYSAIENDELYLRFQPKLNLSDHTISSCEVLLRWESKKTGPNSPDYFIPLAEKDGQINKIGYWVLEKACQTLRNWLTEGIEIKKVAINISPIQLTDISFIDNLIDIVRRYDLDNRFIELEITENYLIANLDEAYQLLKRLKSLGFTISIDDFGKGYSSLGYIAKLPIDVIKLDKSLIDQIDTSSTSLNLVANIINLVHDLNFKVVAEGVEKAEQLELLENMGCDEVQGYLIGRPVLCDELTHYIFTLPK